jgi:glycosyltransferase involved in cell wall biosynthesis
MPRAKSNRKPLHIAVFGQWNWLEVMAELLRRAGMTCENLPDFPRWAFVRWVLSSGWRRFDVIHHIRRAGLLVPLTFAVLNKPFIWHWIGADCRTYGRLFHRGRGWRAILTRRAIHKWAFAHLADSPEVADDLRQYGINAEVVRLLPKTIEAQVIPLPEKPCVLSYWAPIHRDLYRVSVVMQLAEAFPDVPFLIAGDDGKDLSAPKNVKFLGRLPSLTDIYPKISIYIRLVEYDSVSAIVLEALARGRYVLYSKEFPCTELAQNFDEAQKALAKLLTVKEPNKEGSEYIRQNYSIQQQVECVKKLYDRWFGGDRP